MECRKLKNKATAITNHDWYKKKKQNNQLSQMQHHCQGQSTILLQFIVMHLSMLSPRGGGDPGHIRGIWPLLPSPPSGIWLRIWVPGWGRLLFLHGGMRPSHVVPCHVPWFPFRKRSMPYLTVNALIGNQAFQNGWCFICLILGLEKIETGYNLLMELKCTHQMLNFS